jgi:large-conductance mechanosensitive channel
MVMTTTIRTKSPKHRSMAKVSWQRLTIFRVEYYYIVLVFNTVFVIVNILFVLLHFPIFLIPKEDKQLSTAEKDEAKSKDQHEVRQNEDNVQHTNVAAPGSGNGKFLMQDFFLLIYFSYVCV